MALVQESEHRNVLRRGESIPRKRLSPLQVIFAEWAQAVWNRDRQLPGTSRRLRLQGLKLA